MLQDSNRIFPRMKKRVERHPKNTECDDRKVKLKLVVMLPAIDIPIRCSIDLSLYDRHPTLEWQDSISTRHLVFCFTYSDEM